MDPDHQFLTDPAATSRLHKVEETVQRMVRARYTGWSTADREDLVGDVMERYFKKWGRGPGPDPLGPWLATVIKNTAIDRHRKDAAHVGRPVDLQDDVGIFDPRLVSALQDSRSPSLWSARGIAARQALETLTAKDRDLITWRHIDEENFQTIAARTGQKYEAVRKAVQRAVAKLEAAVLADVELRDALFDRPEYPLE